MATEKQLAANRKNALKSTGPKTPEGKAVAAQNALKHGLLAKNAVITEGEGAENQDEFDALLRDFIDQYNPADAIEEMLVEKIAVCCWRLSRANRYEVGVMRQQLDTLTDDYYGQECNMTDTQIEECIAYNQEQIILHNAQLRRFKSLHKQGKDLSDIYDSEDNWKKVEDDLFPPPPEKDHELKIMIVKYASKEDSDTVCKETPSHAIHRRLSKENYSDDQIWQLHIDFCKNQIDSFQDAIAKLNNDKATNKLRLSARKQSAALPPKAEMDTLLRYETAIERQLYRAINQLERCQRRRQGDHVPAPVELDVNLNTEDK